MTRLWFNIRLGYYHWQWGPDGMKITKNDYWRIIKQEHPEIWRVFTVYTLFGKHL